MCVAVLSGLLEKLRLFYEKVPMFADCFKTCSCCCVWRLGALVHGGPDAGMGLCLPVSSHRPAAVPRRQSSPRKLVSAAGATLRAQDAKSRPFGVHLGSLSLTQE